MNLSLKYPNPADPNQPRPHPDWDLQPARVLFIGFKNIWKGITWFFRLFK